MTGQLSLSEPRPYTKREQVLATVVAGFAYPGRGGFERLKKKEQEACLDGARIALERAKETT